MHSTPLSPSFFPELPPIPQPLQFRCITFTALKPGPKLIVLGAVHGNETAGTCAILRLMGEFERGERVLQCGQVGFVPITNPLAYNLKQRQGDRNLNRNLQPNPNPQCFEDHVANWLCPLLAQYDVLLDLHSFHQGQVPFALFGSGNAQELDLALRLGVNRVVDGWLETYAQGVAARVQYARDHGLPNIDLNTAAFNTAALNTDVRYGMGTTEWVRECGGYAVTLECGQHEDPNGPSVAYHAMVSTLAHLQLIDAQALPAASPYENITLRQVVDKHHVDDAFVKAWKSFDRVEQGDLIGRRANGQEVRASMAGLVVFPNAAAQAGQEWFYLASQRTCTVK